MYKKTKLKANKVTYVEKHVIAHDDIITGDGPVGEALVKALS